MAWTRPVAIFFAALGLLLAGMAIWEVRAPSQPRQGLLPIVTTRGDRLFVGLLGAAYLNLAWVGLTDRDPLVGAALGLVVVLILLRWG
jgi:predicted small integral membrane protein